MLKDNIMCKNICKGHVVVLKLRFQVAIEQAQYGKVSVRPADMKLTGVSGCQKNIGNNDVLLR